MQPITAHHPHEPSLSRRLDGAVALVTGAGRGIGRLMASALADAGAAVGLVGRSEAGLADVRCAIEAAGGTAASATADVTDPDALAAAVATVERELGAVDVLINNAGITGPMGPLWEVDPDHWWAAMDVNVRGILLSIHAVLPGMVARRRGRIINLSSQAGVHRWPLASAYSVSKAAVTKLTENLGRETWRHGVSVFSVHPGLLPIGMSETLAAQVTTTSHEEHIRTWTMRTLRTGGGADPADAVALIVRLAAGDADSLSGRHLSVHDDLDAVLARRHTIVEEDLYVQRIDRLPATRSATPGPAYLRGLPADVWRRALGRRRAEY